MSTTASPSKPSNMRWPRVTTREPAGSLPPLGAGLAARGSVQLALRWIDLLPEAFLQTQPRLMLIHATALTFANQLAVAQARALAARSAVPDDGSVAANAVRGWADVVLATSSLYAGDLEASVALAREGLAQLPPPRLWCAPAPRRWLRVPTNSAVM